MQISVLPAFTDNYLFALRGADGVAVVVQATPLSSNVTCATTTCS